VKTRLASSSILHLVCNPPKGDGEVRRTKFALLANGARNTGAERSRRANGARDGCAKGERAEADGRHFVWCGVMVIFVVVAVSELAIR